MSKSPCFCGKPVRTKNCLYCNRHYQQHKNTGKVYKTTRSIRDPNDFIIKDGEGQIILFNKGGEQVAIAIIDIDFLSEAKKHKWHFNGGYVGTSVKVDSKRIIKRLHNFILPNMIGYMIDHRNTIRLDNQKHNLRYVTCQENSFNRNSHKNAASKYKGVFFKKSYGKFVAIIGHNGSTKHLGYFDDEQEAAIAYNNEALKLRPEFCRINENVINDGIPF